jgi:hypothetical protein
MTDPLFPHDCWKDEVANNQTLLGYWAWRQQKIDDILSEQDDND